MPITFRFMLSALGFSALTLTACDQIDAKKLESSLRSILEEKKVSVASVTCPAGRKVKQGDTFDCTAKTEEGQSAVIDCTQNDSAGTIKSELGGALVPEAKLGLLVELDMAKRFDKHETKINVGELKLSCPDHVLFVPLKGEGICEAKLVVVRLGGRAMKIAFSRDDADVTWKPVDADALDDLEAEVEAKLKKDE